jgi:hypothetical protein
MALNSGWYEVNPPVVPSILTTAAQHMLQLLQAAEASHPTPHTCQCHHLPRLQEDLRLEIVKLTHPSSPSSQHQHTAHDVTTPPNHTTLHPAG